MFPSCLSPTSLYGGFLRVCLSAAGLTSQTIDIDDETTIHFWGPNPKPNSKSPPKPTLVLIHGFGPHGVWQWRSQIAVFARDYNVYVPSLVFFGRSTTKSSDRSEVFQAKCIGRLLVEKLRVEKFSVVGTSYGGFVAYHIARMWAERVEKVVVASSGINMNKKDNDDLLKRANAEKVEEFLLPTTAGQLRTLISLCMFRGPSYLPDFVFNDFIKKLYRENRKEKLELLKGLSFGKDNTVNISPLQQDVLIIWGENDQIFLLERATELKELLGKKVRLEVIKSASHLPQFEKGYKFNSILKHFLNGS
nr:epoxide hydrolase 4-like [Ipomoea batatas]